jgi:hypothetical protein
MKVDVLYFEGCPKRTPAVERVREVVQAEGLSAEVVQLEIQDEASAEAQGFLGSPTIRVNGVDIEPSARGAKPTGVSCRYYAGGLPSHDLIRTALREAQSGEGSGN